MAQTATTAAETIRLGVWKDKIVANAIAPIMPPPVPALTDNGLQTAIGGLTNEIRQQHQSTERRELAAENPTFVSRFGEPALTSLMRVCNLDTATDTEDDLPDVHKAMAGNKKTPSRDADVIMQAVDARALQAGSLGHEHNLPVISPELVRVFREHRCTANMDSLGGGLTPSIIITTGEPDKDSFQQRTRTQASIEMGGMMGSLTGTEGAMATVNPKLPTRLAVIVNRLQGWTVLMDVYLGVGHPYATSIRESVTHLVPMLQRLEMVLNEDRITHIGLQVMYYYQCATYLYLGDLQAGRTAELPNINTELIHKLRMAQYSTLPELPSSWIAQRSENPSDNTGTNPRGPTQGRGEGQGTGGRNNDRTSVTNAHPPQVQLNRFKNSDHSSIGTLRAAAGTDWVCPKVGNEDVCLAWHLKGSCWSTCPRKASHKKASNAIQEKLTELLDKAGVPASA